MVIRCVMCHADIVLDEEEEVRWKKEYPNLADGDHRMICDICFLQEVEPEGAA